MTSPHHPGSVATSYHHGHPPLHHQGHYEFGQHGPAQYGSGGGFFPQSYDPHALVSFIVLYQNLAVFLLISELSFKNKTFFFRAQIFSFFISYKPLFERKVFYF